MSEESGESGSPYGGDGGEGPDCYRALAASLDDGVYQLDSEGQFVDVNSVLADKAGYARDELLGMHASILFDDETIEQINRPHERRLESDDDGRTFDGALETVDGQSIACRLRANPVRSNGEYHGTVGIVTEFAETREETPAQSLGAVGKIANVLDQAEVSVFLLDDECEVVWIDETTERYFGIDRADAVGHDKRDLLETTLADRVADAETFRDTLLTAYADNDTLEQFECRITAGAGRKERWLEHVSQPIESGPYAGGRIEFYYDITDRKESERTHQEQSQLFRSLVHAVEEYAIFMLDPDGHVVTWNRGAEKIKGYERNEIIGEHFSTFYTDEAVEAGIPDRNLAAAASEGMVEDEGWRLQQDGSRFWANVTITAIQDESGSLQGFAKVTRDMTDRREHEKLRHRERQLERYHRYINDVLDAVDDVFYVIDEDGTLRRWNESLGEVTGYAEEEIRSMRIEDFFDDEGRISEAIAAGLETGSAHLEAKFRTKAGKSIPYEFAASALESPNGETVLAGIGRDVTDQKAREAKLERRARQQRVVADLGQSALKTDDLDVLMAEAAQAVADVLDNDYCKVLDLDAGSEELLLRQGTGWDDGIVGEATVSSVEANSQAAYTLANDHPIVVENLETEDRFSGPDLLTSHDVRSGISTVIGPFDEPWGILGTHDTDLQSFSDEDVSFVQSVANILAEAIERQQYESKLERLVADLEESNQRLEQFAYAASHDLQEPLRMVSSYLQLIEQRYADEFDEDGEEYLEFAVNGADRMRDMIEALLEYSRVESQGEPFEPIELDDLLESVCEDLQVKIEETDAEITAEKLPCVEGDPSQLRQVFLNLLDNAIEYSGDEPPRVAVSSEPEGDEWVISIADQGIGIDPEHNEQIFQVFKRLHSADDHPGTGIGLALVKRIVQRHGGDIWVESEPGEWTTFSFSLPAAGHSEA